MVTPLAAHAVPGAEVPQSTLGYPEFHGSDTPVPEVAAPYSPASSYLATVFEEDLAAGAGSAPGQDFWVDRMLARSGPMFDATENLVAFTRGRAVFMKTHQPTQLGWAGDVAYWESLGGGGAFTYSVSVDGAPVTLTEQASQRRQTPSYFTSVFTGAGLTLTQTKFITHENVMVANVQVTDTSGADRAVRLTATSPQVQQAEGDELTGAVQAFNALTTVFPRLSGDGFTAQGTTLVTDLAVPASGSATTKLQLGMTTRELPGSEAEYAAVRTASPAEAFTTHVTTYNRWWVENIPYLDTPVDDIDKTLFYRWWLMRFNFLDADIPGNDFQFPTSVEGALGYNNAIVLTVGMFLDDLKYVRDPAYAYGTAISVGETSESGKFTDNPGDPANWSNSYTQYITEAAWRAYELHGGPGAIGGLLGQHAMDDVEGLLDAYDSNGNDLIEYSWGAMTGNDADAVSFHWPGHGANMDRTESAYLYSNSLAAAEFFRVAGEDEKAAHMDALAQRVKDAVLEHLWEPAQTTPDQVGLYGNLLKHRMTQDGTLNPYKETNNYYPFTVGLMPKQGDPDYDPAYVEALRLFADAEQYPVFPFYTANQVDKADSPEEGSNNFSVINSTVLFRMLSSVLRDYPSDYVTPETYKQLLYWNAWAHYQGDGDNRLPNQNEFWSNGSAQDGGSIGYRSWIHHTILGATNFTMIEDAMGLRSRADAKVELDPVDIDWPYFTANNIRYHDRDLTVVWDETGEHYGADVPAGYSVYLDGALAFTVSDLAHVVYDPATGTVEVVEGDAEVVTATTAPLASAAEVTFAADDRVVDVLAKAGTDVAPASTGSVNLAEGRPVTATYSSSGRAPEGAVDGTTVNEPFWGTLSSPNATDSIEVELDGMQAVDDVRVYFYRSSSTATVQGYAAPELFTLEYHDGDGWHTAPDQARTPVYPTANYNRVQLPEVQADRLRVTVTHASGFRTGVKEIQAFATGVPAPAATNAAPDVSVVRDLAFDQPGQVRLVGTVRDDALPAGTLASRWTVVSTPEGADAVIGSPGSATTVVRVDTSGRYVLRLTADDGELSTSRDVVLDVEVSGTAKTNVAPGASATASAVTSWNRVAAINDGNAAFPIAAESDAWATWGTTPGAGGTWTATLTWGAPVRVDESRILFHDNGDPGGILTPSSWSLEYRTAEGTWQPVPSPSEYPTARGELNAVTHASVTTTALRATLVRQGASYPGIVEWQALAEEPVAIEKVAVRTLVGVAPVLPGTVEVLYADGSRAERAVTWQDVPAEAYAEQGSVTVPGFVEGTAGLARATVWVRPTDAVQVNTFTQVAVSTVAGTAPSLPARVVAVYNDGSEASLPVTWDAVDPAGYAEPGELTVQGTVAGTDKRPTAVVTVTEGAAQAPVVALSTEPAVPASGWFTGPVAVTVSATDDSDPAPAVEVRVDDGAWTPYDGPVTVASDGRHAVRARATDSGGLVSAVQTLAVDVDTTAPAVQAVFDEGTRRLTLTTTETGSGVAAVEYRVDGGSWTTYGSGATIAQQAVVEHRATDRAGNVSQIGSLDVPAPDPDAPVNMAPNAAVTVSASTSWNRAAGIVDGNATVPVTSQAAAWGTWNIAGDTQWARLDWPEPVTTSTSRLLFFDDGGGMRVPSAWTLEYLLEDGVTWATVPEPSGFTTTAGAFDTVTHAPVTTTALRATLTKPSTGWVGIVEWEVLSAPRAPMVLEVPAEVAAGQSFTTTLTGGEPGASYAVTLEPGGTALGTLTTDATGAGALTTAALPAGLDAGAYTVRAVAGESVVEAGLTVTAGPEDLVVVPGTVEVVGVPTVGQVLLARAEGWAPDGVTLAYQWFVDGRAVRDATGSEYTPVRRDLGKTVTVEVTGYLEGYEGASATSEPTAAVALPAVQAGTVAVSGDARVGSRQHATAAGWAQDVRLSYRWTVDGEEVRGARGATYTPRPSDVGKALAVEVRGEAPGHTASAWVASPPVTVQPGQIDADDVRILGRAQPRWPLLAWTDPWGPFPVSLTYQWYADGEPIDGATSPFYQVRTADRGAELTVQVTGTRDGYAPATRTSDAVKVGR